MNLVLTYCWREWRAQRGVLLGYLGLGLAALCLVFTLVPESFWIEEGRRALALSWFVALGGIGVLAFVAPTLVRGEYGTKDDQFVRRLPGALVPSFGGKLLFLLLSTLVLPLVALSVGELFLLGNGQGWHDLFRSDHGGSVYIDWPWPVVWLGYAALLIPWVWAIGTWLLSGRMALGGTILFVLLCGLGVVAVLRQCPGLEKGIAWQPWLAAVPVLGLVVAGVSWTQGRRGGGAPRSARIGLLAAACGLVPPTTWLAERAYDYTHPDPQRLVHLETEGLTPDHRYALVSGQSNTEYVVRLPFRIDLHDGSAVQLGGVLTGFSPSGPRPLVSSSPHQQTRYWDSYEFDPWADRITRYRVLDLMTLEYVATSTAATTEAMLREVGPLMLSIRKGDEGPTLLQAPGGVRVGFDGDAVCFEVAPGQVERVRWEGELPRSVVAIGHGFHAHGGTEVLFDLTRRCVVPLVRRDRVLFVRGVQLFQQTLRAGGWLRQDPGVDGQRVVPELEHADVDGLLDDDAVLCRRRTATTTELFTWNPTTGAVVPIALPLVVARGGSIGALAPLYQRGSLLRRDPSGCVWLVTHDSNRPSATRLLRLDPATRIATELPFQPDDSGAFRLLSWPDANSALIQEGATIQRLDVTTGARTQLFPRR